MQSKLFDFIDRIKNSDYKFTNEDFRNIHLDDYTNKSFFYVDPPYLITCATYNEKSGWTEKDERDLLCYLEKLDSKGIRFALSNVLESKGTRNEILSNWLNLLLSPSPSHIHPLSYFEPTYSFKYIVSVISLETILNTFLL